MKFLKKHLAPSSKSFSKNTLEDVICDFSNFKGNWFTPQVVVDLTKPTDAKAVEELVDWFLLYTCASYEIENEVLTTSEIVAQANWEALYRGEIDFSLASNKTHYRKYAVAVFMHLCGMLATKPTNPLYWGVMLVRLLNESLTVKNNPKDNKVILEIREALFATLRPMAASNEFE